MLQNRSRWPCFEISCDLARIREYTQTNNAKATNLAALVWVGWQTAGVRADLQIRMDVSWRQKQFEPGATFDETSAAHLYRHGKCNPDNRAAEHPAHAAVAAVLVMAGVNRRYRVHRPFRSCLMVLRGDIPDHGHWCIVAVAGPAAKGTGHKNTAGAIKPP